MNRTLENERERQREKNRQWPGWTCFYLHFEEKDDGKSDIYGNPIEKIFFPWGGFWNLNSKCANCEKETDLNTFCNNSQHGTHVMFTLMASFRFPQDSITGSNNSEQRHWIQIFLRLICENISQSYDNPEPWHHLCRLFWGQSDDLFC